MLKFFRLALASVAIFALADIVNSSRGKDLCDEILNYNTYSERIGLRSSFDNANDLRRRWFESGRRVATMFNSDIVAGRRIEWCGMENKIDQASLLKAADEFIKVFGVE